MAITVHINSLLSGKTIVLLQVVEGMDGNFNTISNPVDSFPVVFEIMLV